MASKQNILKALSPCTLQLWAQIVLIGLRNSCRHKVNINPICLNKDDSKSETEGSNAVGLEILRCLVRYEFSNPKFPESSSTF